MKKYGINLCLVFALLLALIGCDEERTTYTGPNYIMFSDTLYVLPVQDNVEYFDIPVSATRTSSKDRTLAVEVIDKKSNAIEGIHYTLESNTSTIKAGELATNVRVRGIYDNISVSDSLGLALRLVIEEENHGL